jgi:uncharacterized protein (DUF2249 family)
MTATLIQPTFVLDLRTIPPRERHPLIFGRFDALATGQALQLVNDHNPQPLRYQFEDRAFGQFEWTRWKPARRSGASRSPASRTPHVPIGGAKGDSCCSGGACCG